MCPPLFFLYRKTPSWSPFTLTFVFFSRSIASSLSLPYMRSMVLLRLRFFPLFKAHRSSVLCLMPLRDLLRCSDPFPEHPQRFLRVRPTLFFPMKWILRFFFPSYGFSPSSLFFFIVSLPLPQPLKAPILTISFWCSSHNGGLLFLFLFFWLIERRHFFSPPLGIFILPPFLRLTPFFSAPFLPS